MINKKRISVDLDNNLVDPDNITKMETELDKFFAQDNITDQDLGIALKSESDEKLNKLYKKSIEKYVVKKSYQQTSILSDKLNQTKLRISKITNIWMTFVMIFIAVTLGAVLGLFFVTNETVVNALMITLFWSQLITVALLIGCLLSSSAIRDRMLDLFEQAMVSGIPIIPQNSNFVSNFTKTQKEILSKQLIQEMNFGPQRAYKKSGLKIFGSVLLIIASLGILACVPLMFVYKSDENIFKILSYSLFGTTIVGLFSFICIAVGQRKEIKNLIC